MAKDGTEKSMPEPVKIRVESLDRNVLVRKLKLGPRLKLLRIMFGWLDRLTGAKKKDFLQAFQRQDAGAVTAQADIVGMFELFERDHEEVLLLVTDLQKAEIQDLEIEEVVTLLGSAWGTNGLSGDLARIPKVFGGGPPGPAGSSEPSPSSPSTPAIPETTS